MASGQHKSDIFQEVRTQLEKQNFQIVSEDPTRPWGGFFVLAEEQAQQFADTYFEGIRVEDLRISGKLSPKVLLVEPGKRLSWQYHDRRAEIWQIIEGTVGIIVSPSDEEGPVEEYKPGQGILLGKGLRHRAVGMDDWAIIAEIWQHTDLDNPSDESDIVRIQDDFGR